MAKKKTTTQIKDFAFFEYLWLFYQQNRKTIRSSYNNLTKKFLDFNNPENADAFLRPPQFEALEMYVFLKEYLDNKSLQQIFTDWYNKQGKFSGRDSTSIKAAGTLGIFEELDAPTFQKSFDALNQVRRDYPNYIFALTMGLGKTILMGTCIFYEFLLANKYPKSPNYAHNAIVFAPDKTVLESLREIQTFDKSKVVPPEYLNWLDTHLQFHFLNDSGVSLNIIDKSQFNLIISNTQKIILKKQRKTKTKAQIFIEGTESVYKAKTLNTDYDDLYDFDSEIELLENQRFSKLSRLSQLAVYIDEAHHAFGKTAENLRKSLRLTIDELSANLQTAGTHIIGCYNYTGTPYLEGKILPEVVYAFGLKGAIERRYLKQVRINGFSNAKSKEFVKKAITEFWTKHQGKRYENMLPKIAFFASSINELEEELKPAVQEVLDELQISTNKILVNVGDSTKTSNDDIREFNNLDTPRSEKQFILLVNKGQEGWNCRSLFAIGLHRTPKSRIFILQATMRCLRSIGEVQETGRVYLSEDNVAILNEELQANMNMSVSELNNSGDQKKEYEVRLVPPPVKIKLKRISKLYNLKSKTPKEGIDFKLEEAPTDQYKVTLTESAITRPSTILREEDITSLREKREFTALTLTAEIAKYLNCSCIELNKVLSESKQGMSQLLEAVNQFNELLYDWIIPHLFDELYDLRPYTNEEEFEVELIKTPPIPYNFYKVKAKPELVAELSNLKFAPFREKSFHLDTYCFDSNPENNCFWQLLNDAKVKKVYFTGMFTHNQTDFKINYIDPESHTVRSYYPDFLVQNIDDSFTIIEIKADGLIDDTVVKAKAEYARQIAIASGMSYEIRKATDYQF